MSRMTEIIVNLGCKLGEIFQTVYGWAAAAGIFVMNFFAGYETAINAVVICVALDTVWGIAAQIKRGHFALSELGRHGMLSKLALYASVIVGFVLLERMANLESQLAVIAICTLICLVELWSMGGSALIVNPEDAVPAHLPRGAGRRGRPKDAGHGRGGQEVFGWNQ